jgi:hypothetical protein
LLVDKAGERETNVSYGSTIKSITLYQAEQLNEDEAVLAGKIEVETKVGDFAPNKYQQLVECEAVKDSEGVFQVDSQTLTNLGVKKNMPVVIEILFCLLKIIDSICLK